jgi:tRNA isopentenyl-2-thiomethyl-A-37 hydroxylase MiaE
MLFSCNSFINNRGDDKIVAQVAGNKLTLSQLEMSIPENINDIDSISFAQNYIEKWVKDHLLLEKAEINLDKKTQQSIEIMIDNYRTSLLLFKYQQMIIRQKLDTVVTKEQIIDYYKKHADNFRLDSCVVKAVYVQLPKSLYDRYKVRNWIRSKKEDDIISLEDYCYQNARNFYMGENWQYFNNVMSDIPKKITDCSRFLKYNKYVEATDSLYAYYIYFLDYKLPNDTTPVMFVKDKIKDIILNHRKVKLINDLENNIYNDAVDQKKFIIHSNIN